MSFGRLLFLAAIAVGIVLPIRLWVAEPITIATPSMEPTFPVGAFVAHGQGDLELARAAPRRGHRLFPPPGEEKELVKRVIGIPGRCH